MFKKILTVTILSLLVVPVSLAQDIKKTGGLARLSGMGANPMSSIPSLTRLIRPGTVYIITLYSGT